MKIKKFLVVFFVVLVSLSIIAISAQQITITVQDYFTTGGQLEFLNGAIKTYEASHPNVTINHVYVPRDSIMQKTLQEKLTGTLPDIIMADNPWVPSLIQAGIWMNIKPYVENWDYYKTMYKPYKDLGTYNGGFYTLQYGTNNVLLFYNGKYLKEAGITELPTTWDQLLQVCAQLKDKLGSSGIYPIGFSADPNEECTWQFEPFLWSNGGNLLDLSSTPSVQALQFWTTLVQKGYAPKSVVNWEQGDVGTMFANGKLAMMINGCWEFDWHVLPDVVSKYDVGVVEMPVPKAGLNPVVPFGGESYGIAFNEPADRLPTALDFLKFLYSTENIAKWDLDSSDIPVAECVVSSFENDLSPSMRSLLEPFMEQSKHAVARAIAGGGTLYLNISPIVWTAIEQALIGSKTPEEAFLSASQQIKGLFPNQSAYEQAFQEASTAVEEAMK